MSLTMNSTIIELSAHPSNFQCCRGLTQRGAWGQSLAKIDVKITLQNSHFSKFHYIHLPFCITSIPIKMFTLVTQLTKL